MFRVEIETGNAAIADAPYDEVARILRVIADKLEDGYSAGRAYDANGNDVGSWDLTGMWED